MSETAKEHGGGHKGNGRDWKPGQSGNPKGRPKSFSVLIDDQYPTTAEDLVAFWRLVAFGTDKAIKAHFKTTKAPTFKERVLSANALADRYRGKPIQSHEHAGPNGGPIPYANLQDDELDARLQELASAVH